MKGAILWTVDSPHCKCNVGGGKVGRGEKFFSRMLWEKVNLHVYKLLK
jgi:hypothetical protein